MCAWQNLGAVAPVRRAPDTGMRLILRILGTWLIGLALVLLVIDGTRWLANGTLGFETVSATLGAVYPPALGAVRDFVSSRFFAPILGPVAEALLEAPSFAVVLVPGILLAFAGRVRATRTYLRQDSI